jgi:protein O-GlcNAc transferase
MTVPGLVVLWGSLTAAILPQEGRPPGAQSLEAVRKLVEAGQWAPAERSLRAILARGEDPVAHDLLGAVLTREGRPKEAEEQLRRALSLSPTLHSAREHLARLYLGEERDAEAAMQLRRAAQEGPLERDLALKLAAIELADHHPAEAVLQLRSAADRFHSVEALMRLARLESAGGDAQGALQTLRRAASLAPNSVAVLSAEGQVALAARAPAIAIGALEPLTRIDPEGAQHPYLLGVAFLQIGDMAAAADALVQSERLEPDRPLTLVALGMALNGRKLYQEAKPRLVRSLELEPGSIEGKAALAEAEEGMGALGEAETHARAVLAQATTNATANLVLGMVLMKQGRFSEAREPLESAVAADPTAWKAHYQLSLACARLGDEAGAQRHLDLFQKNQKAAEERMNRIRRDTGLDPTP